MTKPVLENTINKKNIRKVKRKLLNIIKNKNTEMCMPDKNIFLMKLSTETLEDIYVKIDMSIHKIFINYPIQEEIYSVNEEYLFFIKKMYFLCISKKMKRDTRILLQNMNIKRR